MSDPDWTKEWAKNRRESELRDNANAGKVIMLLCGVLIISMAWPGHGPWHGVPYSGETLGLAFAGIIWGFVMWIKGRDKL